jgi:hypothetical protein
MVAFVPAAGRYLTAAGPSALQFAPLLLAASLAGIAAVAAAPALASACGGARAAAGGAAAVAAVVAPLAFALQVLHAAISWGVGTCHYGPIQILGTPNLLGT